MIRRRDPGHFGKILLIIHAQPQLILQNSKDSLAGPIILSIALFSAVLANFIIRGEHTHSLHNRKT